MKKLLLGTAISLAMVGVAAAADLPPAPPPEPAPYVKAPPVWSWTGFYIGDDIGVGWAKTKNNSISDPNNAAFAACGACFTPGFTAQSFDLSSSGFLGGLH